MTKVEEMTINKIMTQKTIYTTAEYKIGDEVLLYSRSYQDGSEEFKISKKFAAEGYPGNMNCNIKRLHGWRGETNNVSVYAYGRRKVIKVTATDKENDYGDTIYKVVVGRDIAPDED